MSDLKDIFDGVDEPVEAAVAEPVVEATPEPVHEPVTEVATPDATGDEPVTPVEDAPPASGEPVLTVPLAAQLDEREKRQKAEARAEALQRQLDSIQQQRPDEFEDPAAAEAFDRDVQAKAERDRRVTASEIYCEDNFPDYKEIVDTHGPGALAADPGLFDRASQSPFPMREVYIAAKRFAQQAEIAKVGDLTAYREKVRAEVLEEERAKNEAGLKPPDIKLPESLVDETNTGSNVRSPDRDDLDEPLAALIGR